MSDPATPRDPFPMRSDEAARLAASVPSSSLSVSSSSLNENFESWSKMSTRSSDSGRRRVSPLNNPSSSTGDCYSDDGQAPGGTQKESLTGKRKKSRGRRNEIIDATDFFERPLPRDRGRGRNKALAWVSASTLLVFRRLYGDSIPLCELVRVMCLSMTLFFMIGGYWLLRSLKDPVLTALCGVSVIPKAKMASVVVVLGVVSIYNKLLDSDIAKHKLFFVFGSFYFCLFASVAFLLADETMGLPNQQPDPGRILGWVSYCGIESFGSVMVSLFWSFSNSNVTLESAKASYGLLVATAQIGSILGPTVVNHYAETMGVPTCYFAGACSMLLLQLAMYLYIHIYGPADKDRHQSQSQSSLSKPKAGVLEGLKLFKNHNYVKGIFAISCLFMVEVTIVDFTMKVLAKEHFAIIHPCKPNNTCWDPLSNSPTGLSADATNAFTTFMGLFGQATNTLSFLLSLLGTSAVIRTLGLRFTLLLFPSICLGTIFLVRYNPTLWVVFAAMMLLKACSYALNNPTKEILYQPTSPAVKYKAKSWIDIFGARGSKALGSLVTNAFSDSATHLVQNGSLVGMAVASFLIWNATFMGKKFDEYMETGYVVGEEKGEDSDEVRMAMKQNEESDTSCAIYDDDDDDQEENEDKDEDNDEEKGGDEEVVDDHKDDKDDKEKEDANIEQVEKKESSSEKAIVTQV